MSQLFIVGLNQDSIILFVECCLCPSVSMSKNPFIERHVYLHCWRGKCDSIQLCTIRHFPHIDLHQVSQFFWQYVSYIFYICIYVQMRWTLLYMPCWCPKADNTETCSWSMPTTMTMLWKNFKVKEQRVGWGACTDNQSLFRWCIHERKACPWPHYPSGYMFQPYFSQT